jgi:putative ABC transport system permease protein
LNFSDPPIAWQQLRAQKSQTISAIASIAFITALLFMQIGFRSAFLHSLLELPSLLKGDLFVFHASSVSALRPLQFSLRRLSQIPAFEEVESVMPIYTTPITMPDPSGQPELLRRVLVMGFPLLHSPLDIPEVDARLDILKRRGVFLIDELSRKQFRPIIEDINRHGRSRIEINAKGQRKQIFVEGLFPLGVSDVDNSHLLTSDTTFLDIFNRPRNMINIGLVSVHPGADPQLLAEKLREYLPSDVMVLLKHEMLAKDRHLFEFGTPLGIVFRIAVGTAVMIGIVVLYQILFQLVSKYLRDYATLKALGFSHGMLLRIVFTQALILAILGYLPGTAISLYLFEILTVKTGMEHVLTSDVAFSVLALVCFICLVSALLAIRQLRAADPADLFG